MPCCTVDGHAGGRIGQGPGEDIVFCIYFTLATIRGELSGFGLEWNMLWRRSVVVLVAI